MDILNKDEYMRNYMRSYMKKYMQQNYVHVSLNLKKGEDDELIERMYSVPNKSDYLKDLVRNDIRKEQQNIQGDRK